MSFTNHETARPLSAGLDAAPAASPARSSAESIDRPFARRLTGRWAVSVAVVVALLAVLGYVDAITGPELSLAFCYLVPVILATWFIGRGAGFLLSVASAGTWLVAERYGAAAYAHPWVAYWNATIRLAFFLLAASMLARFKELRDHLHAMVEARTQTLRRLAAQLSEAEDAERRRLAHDVHDGFSQMLSMLKLNLAAARGEGRGGDERLDGAIEVIDELIHRARTLTFELHPAMLDHLGLVPTLRRYGEQFGRPLGIDVTVTEVGPPHTLPATLTNYLFRAVKELLNNVAKHGRGATEAVVAVHWEAGALRVVVDDDGAGFDAAAVARAVPGPGTGLGLAGIRERMTSFGGSLRVESAQGQGTRAVLEVPLPPADQPGSRGGEERTG